MGNRREAAAQVLRVLARLAPPPTPEGGQWSIPLDWFEWLPAGEASFLATAVVRPFGSSMGTFRYNLRPPHREEQEGADVVAPVLQIDARSGARLAEVDRLRTDRTSLRVGWLFLAGTTEDPGGGRRAVFQPLIERAVVVRTSSTALAWWREIVPVNDARVSPLIEDRNERWHLEHAIEFGGGALSPSTTTIAPVLLRRLDRLTGYAQRAAAAAGFPGAPVVPADAPPEALRDRDGVAVVVGFAVYAVHRTPPVGAATSLRTWSSADLGPHTAFHTLYCSPDESANEHPDPALVQSSIPLTPSQRTAGALSRSAPITVVTGAPGNGKSTTITAVAGDAVARGESVLVVAASEAAVDSLVELFEATPGLDPIVFGSSERLAGVLDRLAHASERTVSDDEIDASRRALGDALATRERVRAVVRAALDVAVDPLRPEELVAAIELAPALFEPTTDLDEIAELIEAARREHHRRWSLRHGGSATHRLDELLPIDHAVDVAEELLPLARRSRAARAVAEHRLSWSAALDDLAVADLAVAARVGELHDRAARTADRLDRGARRAIDGLREAISLGRAARRDELARCSAVDVASALPLWVGSLADVDDLLPVTAAAFDVVILDEASAVDQTLAATALLRGRRAVVVGDPRQLRAVPSVTDSEVDEALAAEGIDDQGLAAKLDVRHTTVLDLAIGAAPVITLDEHFRSAPHLVEFVARRLYGGAFAAATRNPATASLDCIDVVRVDGRRDRAKVVPSEVATVVAELRRLHRQGFREVGVLTPFRPQADALERAILAELRAPTRDELDLRVGTVHDFQGFERDTIIASLGVGDGADPAVWRVVEDPHLFAVMVTRARRRMIVVVSGDPPAHGLVTDYLALANSPPGPPEPAGPLTPWAATVLDHLTHAGIPALGAYPTGRHVIDICVGDERRWFGLECEVHPDGPDAHIDRHLALRRAGWTLHDAFPSQWRGREGELVVEIERLLGSG